MARKRANRKTTSEKVARRAGKLLSSARNSTVRSVAGSALSQTVPRGKRTSRRTSIAPAFKAGKDLEE